jgi:acetolactate synthase-1/2/3 large subunit
VKECNKSRKNKDLTGFSLPQNATGAQLIARTIKEYGISHVFFIEAIMRDALVELEAQGIKRVMAHSEKAAAYMADGYARIRKGPGVCLAQAVGAANLAAGLQDAYLGHSPVIALTGKKPPSHQHRNAYQEINHIPLFEAVTKFNAPLDDPEELPRLLRQAIREATGGKPGPAHIDMMGVVGHLSDRHQYESGLDMHIEGAFSKVPPFRPVPGGAALDDAACLLASAKRPVMVCGGGAVISGAGGEIRRMAESQRIPVAATLNGKTALPDGHPLKVGIVGSYSNRCANQVVSSADLVVFIGSGTGDMSTNDWRVPQPGMPVIQIDIDPCELGRSYPNQVSLLGDAKETIRRLNARLKGGGDRTGWLEQVQAIVEQWRAEIKPLLHSKETPIRVERLCSELSNLLPEDTILVADTGYAGTWTGTLVELRHPGQQYIRAAGSLGWAFPAAMGAKCAAPDKPVICFTGDGGLWYHLSEIETALRCGINTITVVNNNHGFGQCVETIEKAYGKRGGKPQELYKFRETNFAELAREFGCMGIRVEDPSEIAGVFKKALAAREPVIIDVQTGLMCRPAEPWTS